MTDRALTRFAAIADGAAVLGAEIETRYRVLAVTIEPDADAHPRPQVSDRRLQVLLHPVSRIAAISVDGACDPPVLHRFREEQLVDVVAALDGAVGRWTVDGPTPEPSTWAPALSMEGASSAPDGRSHHAVLEMAGDDGRRLRLAAWFDEVEVRDPTGDPLFSSGPLGGLG